MPHRPVGPHLPPVSKNGTVSASEGDLAPREKLVATQPKEVLAASRRTNLVRDTLRRLLRRGARSNASNLLRKTRPEDVALVLPDLTIDQQVAVFDILVRDYPEGGGAVLTEVEPAVRRSVLEHLTAEQVASILEHIAVDDAVFVVESLPEDRREQVLDLVSKRELDQVQEQLTYGDESAGRIMDPQYFALSEDRAVGEAIEALRDSRDLENIFYVYVVDSANHLVGVTSLRQLLLASPDRRLGEVMSGSVIKVHIETDQEEVAEFATRYNLLAIPVTDDENRLVGIVTVDDIIDVVQEEATEDFFKMVGTSDDELLYQDRPLKVAGIRLPWLLGNLVGLVLAGNLWESFQSSMDTSLVFLTGFVPAIMGMGGNIGSQTSTIAVRGLATGRISTAAKKVMAFLWQQVKVGTVIGVSCAVVVGLWAMARAQNPYYAVVVGVGLFLAIMVASINGTLAPIVFDRLGIDPAVAAGPIVTTTNDITGILIYWGLASLLIDLLVH